MRIKVKLSAAWLATAIAVAGCAGNEPVYQPKAFSPVPIDSTAYVPAVDAFVILMDTSSSMAENQNRLPARQGPGSDLVRTCHL